MSKDHKNLIENVNFFSFLFSFLIDVFVEDEQNDCSFVILAIKSQGEGRSAVRAL